MYEPHSFRMLLRIQTSFFSLFNSICRVIVSFFLQNNTISFCFFLNRHVLVGIGRGSLKSGERTSKVTQ